MSDRFPGFTLKPRRGFWVFVAAVLLLAIAALNTGNNALYLLLAGGLGAFVASGALSRHTLRHLEVRVQGPPEAFAGSSVRLEVSVRNLSPFLPAAGVVCRVLGPGGHLLVPEVPPGRTVRAGLMTLFPRRGRHPLPDLRVEVRLPLGFFVKAVRVPGGGEPIMVFPRRFPGGAPRWGGAADEEVGRRRGPLRRGGEVQQLREFRAGDDRRDIHWKQTARQHRLIVAERREPIMLARYLVLDREVPRPGDETVARRFEDLVSEVATAALDLLRRGEAVGLVVGGRVIPPGSGAAHGRLLLTTLALVEAVAPGRDPLPALPRGGAVYRLAEAS